MKKISFKSLCAEEAVIQITKYQKKSNAPLFSGSHVSFLAKKPHVTLLKIWELRYCRN